MKRRLTPEKITKDGAEVFCPILELLYSYGFDEEPEYNKIKFMF